MDKTALLRSFGLDHHSPHSEVHSHAAQIRAPGTGSWIFNHEDFQAWSQHKNSLLWLRGRAGSGKTILCSTIIDNLSHRYRTDKSTAVLNFYFTANSTSRNTDESLLSSLIVQMGSLLEAVPSELSTISNLVLDQQPSFELLFRVFAVVMQCFRQIFVVIDGLNECLDPRRLMATLQSMIDWNLDGLHLLLSSRPWAIVREVMLSMERCLVINIADFNRPDIQKFVHLKLSGNDTLKDLTQAAKSKVESDVIDRADGLFAYVTAVLKHLIGPPTSYGIELMLEKLPKDLDELYEYLINIYTHQSSPASVLVWDVLMWVGHARRPLRIEEVAAAMAIDVAALPILSPQRRLIQPSSVLSICPSLLHTTSIKHGSESYEAVVLVHYTIQSYVDTKDPPWTSHVQIARACLRYLCLLDRADSLNSPDYTQCFPLADYAARFWHYHMQMVGRAIPHQKHADLALLLEAATDFFNGPKKIYLQNWVKLYDPDRSWIVQPNTSKKLPAVSTPLYYASCLRLAFLVRHLLESGDHDDLDAIGGVHGTALQAAAYHGDLAIVELLLQFNADPFIRAGIHGTALQAARFVRHDEITDLLRAKMDELCMEEGGLDAVELDLPGHIVLNPGEHNPYVWRKMLGNGKGTSVDIVESVASGSLCVRKTIRIQGQEEQRAEERQRLVEVVRLMEKLNHIHFVKMLGSYSLEPEFFILMVPIARCDLKNYMAGNNADPHSLTRWIGCLARGLAYLHGKGIKHKDIKPGNILVHDDNILYTDFDLAHTFQSLNDVTNDPTRNTLPYSAPEVIDGGERTPTTDVFSLGCVYVEMLTIIAGKRVFDIFQKSTEADGYNFRGPNNARALAWIEELSFGVEKEAYIETVRLTKLMISQERPDAETLGRHLGSLACDSCAQS